MRRTYQLAPNPQDEKIKRLETDLFLAREDIIWLMPQKKREILKSFYECELRSQTHGWKDEAVGKLVALAEVLPRNKGSSFSERANCPLCGDESSSRYESGFSVPEGLRRHLIGFGNVRQCVVTAAAFELARNYWNSNFEDSERKQEAQNKNQIENRRKSETLYLTSLNSEPCLRDEVTFWRVVRTDEELAWAEKRLSDLGFRIVLDINIKSYIDSHESYIVYADPRSKGEITFSAHKLPVQKKQRKSRVENVDAFSVFKLPDSWKNDLSQKYQARVAKAIDI